MHTFNLWITLLTIAVAFGAILGTLAYLILAERKISAWVQDRKGPNRVGPGGLLQPIADGLKFLLKEEVVPGHVDKIFYFIGPSIAISMALLAFAVVPFGPTTPAPQPRSGWPQTVQQEAALKQDLAYQTRAEEYGEKYQFVIAPGLDIGMVFVFAVGSLHVYAVVLGGWSSNNKYSFMGSLRASAQVISYEIPLGMSILGIALLAGSLNLERIIDYQIQHGWFLLFQPLALILFVTAVFAECNRLPFDLSECEQELVGGFHTEYSGMKFAMFFLGEYTHMITSSFLFAALFLGGWHLPGVTGVEGFAGVVLKLSIFVGKMALFIFFFMLIRWTVPRFRFDQLMGLAWKVLIPLSILNLVAALLVKEARAPLWVLSLMSFVLFVGAGYFTASTPSSAAGRPKQVADPHGTHGTHATQAGAHH